VCNERYSWYSGGELEFGMRSCEEEESAEVVGDDGKAGTKIGGWARLIQPVVYGPVAMAQTLNPESPAWHKSLGSLRPDFNPFLIRSSSISYFLFAIYQRL
jgi:hypothetical protein